MMTSTSLTLKDISELLDQKFTENNKLIFTRFDGIDDRLDAQSERISKMDNEMKTSFNWVYKKLQEILGFFDERDKRIEKLERRVFA